MLVPWRPAFWIAAEVVLLLLIARADPEADMFFLWAVSLQTWTCDQLTRSIPTVDACDRAPESEGAEREAAR